MKELRNHFPEDLLEELPEQLLEEFLAQFSDGSSARILGELLDSGRITREISGRIAEGERPNFEEIFEMFLEEYLEKHPEVFLEKLLEEVQQELLEEFRKEAPKKFLVKFCERSPKKFSVEFLKHLWGINLTEKNVDEIPVEPPEEFLETFVKKKKQMNL